MRYVIVLMLAVGTAQATEDDDNYRSRSWGDEDYQFETRKYDNGKRVRCTTTKIDGYSFTTCREN